MNAVITCNGYATRSSARGGGESGERRIAVANWQCNLHYAPLKKLQLAWERSGLRARRIANCEGFR
jgi:hypothetical protein